MEINIADTLVKVSELQPVDVATMKKAVKEVPCTTNNFLFYVLFFNVIKSGDDNGVEITRKYASDIISVIEQALGIKYSTAERNVLAECYTIAKCGKSYALQDRISDIENLSVQYSREEPGTIV